MNVFLGDHCNYEHISVCSYVVDIIDTGDRVTILKTNLQADNTSSLMCLNTHPTYPLCATLAHKMLLQQLWAETGGPGASACGQLTGHSTRLANTIITMAACAVWEHSVRK